ncbi:hypothetical protein GDO81_020799 [Engystomops pustulosus]|uniref:Uncharacterized protein n=1 Tax=Engystomops pustulosus TaxID=76066 RepID=A0AAV6ZSJ1_ENGPU|nr:hypothetical protein GDO81_020799 [Engystomops pustulosus]
MRTSCLQVFTGTDEPNMGCRSAPEARGILLKILLLLLYRYSGESYPIATCVVAATRDHDEFLLLTNVQLS